MQIDTKTLDREAQRQWDINQALMAVTAYLRDTRAPADVLNEVENARELAAQTQRSLIRAGAADPLHGAQQRTRESLLAAGFDAPEPEPLSLRLLTSENMQVYARAIREAAELRKEVDQERGIEDGLAELLDDLACDAELEVNGPVGLRE